MREKFSTQTREAVTGGSLMLSIWYGTDTLQRRSNINKHITNTKQETSIKYQLIALT